MACRAATALESAADLVLSELRPRGVDARAPSALDRVPSTPFDTTAASIAALLALCQHAASERQAGHPQAACIGRAVGGGGPAGKSGAKSNDVELIKDGEQ